VSAIDWPRSNAGYNARVKLRRLLFAALLAVCFDVAVPLEASVHGGLVWEDDEEEAVRADQRRASPATAERAPAPGRDAIAVRARLTARRRSPRAVRRVRVARVVHSTAPPPRPAATEDH
jgi:hypothetical protein